MNLADRACSPCPPGTRPLDEAARRRLGTEVPRWEISETKLARTLAFPSFPDAIRFVNAVAALAEAEQHHPDLHIHYDRVRIELWTHSVGGLSENDFILAAKIDRLLGDQTRDS